MTDRLDAALAYAKALSDSLPAPERTEAQRRATREAQARYRADPEHRHKLRAREATSRAVRSGRLKRLPCELCHSRKSEAHHPDYSEPLLVEWLCRRCHGIIHAQQ